MGVESAARWTVWFVQCLQGVTNPQSDCGHHRTDSWDFGRRTGAPRSPVACFRWVLWREVGGGVSGEIWRGAGMRGGASVNEPLVATVDTEGFDAAAAAAGLGLSENVIGVMALAPEVFGGDGGALEVACAGGAAVAVLCLSASEVGQGHVSTASLPTAGTRRLTDVQPVEGYPRKRPTLLGWCSRRRGCAVVSLHGLGGGCCCLAACRGFCRFIGRLGIGLDYGLGVCRGKGPMTMREGGVGEH